MEEEKYTTQLLINKIETAQDYNSKKSLITSFLQPLHGNQKIIALDQIIKSNKFISNENSAALAEICQESGLKQEDLANFCANNFEQNQTENKKLFILHCCTNKFLNDFSSIKKVLLQFDQENLTAMLEERLFKRVLKLNDAQKQEILDEKELNKSSHSTPNPSPQPSRQSSPLPLNAAVVNAAYLAP